ncbi:centriolar coiled-coil protein of 110 kDa [Gracilinanus agilis]|uniref:centriolar coiled-coil protein of 110 kDa n=1 Tax=Gracilinanus agilis TaxID=191870 RepID=UPI001CFD4494|nr:centriolar coiled-coil protein of 110 kDa [Gracilinanus agilis]
MEEYEKFFEKSLARIQEESLPKETFPAGHLENISLIRFHGVAVLSPLLSVERRKEMQQEKQKALDVEARKQISRKKALLNRVQEILENVQVRKAPNISDFDQWEPEAVYRNSEVKNLDVPTILPKDSLPSLPEHSASTKVQETIEILPADTTAQVKLNGTDSGKGIGECISDKQSDSPNPNLMGKETSPETSADTSQETLIADEIPKREGELGPSRVEEATSDPYIMSLQNLMKKSKEYIEREQIRRSIRNNSKKSTTESHSDKENDAVKMSDSGKENTRCISKSCGSLSLDKPSLNKSNILLQSATTQTQLALASFSKVDLPVRMGTPTLLDSDEDEDFKVTSTFDPESSVVKSFTGSYAKLPSPEPSVSPKMHRRRPKSSSTGHIFINNPVNAYELSPKEKGRAMDLIIQDINEKTNISESVPKFPIDLTEVCSSKVPIVSKNTSETGDEESDLGKSNEMDQHSANQFENRVIQVTGTVEGQIASDGREPHKIDNNYTIVTELHEPYVASQCMVSQKCGIRNVIKPTSVLEKNCNSQMELNKSYDVQNPSPLLMQSQNKRQQMDTPNGPCGNEQFVENSFEKVKRRLDLDVDGLQKESSPYVLTTGTVEQEKRWIREKRYPKGSVFINKNELLEMSSREGEEMLKNKMLAFEEMRKRLEEQHAQQLSILIAEQEKEQEKLQKEIEEQERILKEKKETTAETPEVKHNKAVELEWRKISDSGLLETMLSQVDTLHIANSNNSAFTNSTLQHSFASTSEVPFYLWGSSTSGLPKIAVTRPLGRGKNRCSQVFSLEVQAKFDKITAVAKGFLTRRLLQTEKVKHLRQTVKDTMEFIRSFQSEAPLKRGSVSAQDASLQERVLAQLRAALFDIHDIFFIMDATERMSILHHDREVRKEKMLRQMDKMKNPRASLSAATQKSLDRKKYMKVAEMGMPNRKILIRQKPSETRVLQPSQGQNAPIHRPLCRQGTPKTSVKGVEQSREKSSDNRMPNRVPVSGAYAGKTQRKQPNVATI